jgi:DNA ligase 1
VRPMLAQRLSEPAEILAKLGGSCAAEHKYDGIRVQAHRTADGALELYTRRLERVSTQFPELVELLDESLGPREVILEGEAVAFDPAAGELRPFQDVMFRRRKYGITEAVSDFPVSLFCFELLYADGEDLTRLPHLERRARLAQAVTPSERLRLATAEQVGDEAALERMFEQAVAEGCEGLICKSVSPTLGYQAGARGWSWIKLKRDYRSELSDTLDLVVVGGLARPGTPGRDVRGPAAGRLRPRRRPVPDHLQVRHRLLRRRAGRPPGPPRPARPPPTVRSGGLALGGGRVVRTHPGGGRAGR